jgi:hypothetical protein
VTSLQILMYISLISNDIEPLFMDLFVILRSSLVEGPFKSFVYVMFSSCRVKNSSRILDLSPLWDLWLTNFCPQSLGFHFIFLTLVFIGQNF